MINHHPDIIFHFFLQIFSFITYIVYYSMYLLDIIRGNEGPSLLVPQSQNGAASSHGPHSVQGDHHERDDVATLQTLTAPLPVWQTQ